jgi:lysozyme
VQPQRVDLPPMPDDSEGWVAETAPEYIPFEGGYPELEPPPYVPFEDNYPEEAMQSNVAAFLTLIRQAEGTEDQPDPYRVVYGYGTELTDLSLHPLDPQMTPREWEGVRLRDEQCRGAGYGVGCKSTAAGAYQFNWPTWADLGLAGTSFEPDAQDAAAIALLDRIGALSLIQAGDLDGALQRASYRWASLPPRRVAGQPTRTLQWARSVFLDNGGTEA